VRHSAATISRRNSLDPLRARQPGGQALPLNNLRQAQSSERGLPGYRSARPAILFKTRWPALAILQDRTREATLPQRELIHAPYMAAGNVSITIIEPVERPLPTWRETLSALNRHTVTNAFIAWLYAVTGPLAILLAVASSAGFGHDQLATWLFGAYAIGGLISILTSYLYRQPSGIAFSILGAILIGPALNHLGFAEVVGASLVAGVVIAVLGLTGWVRKVMSLCPLPVVMGMVCGVFLPFGLKIVTGFRTTFG
jgi:hypothetical protein